MLSFFDCGKGVGAHLKNPRLAHHPQHKRQCLVVSLFKKGAFNSSIQTRFNGVIANIIHFEKSGESVILQLMVQNTSSRVVHGVCFYESQTNLIDEATSESWHPKESVGQPCTSLEIKKSSRMWMKFAVPNPEKRTFSLSSPLFHGTLDNLVLTEPS